MPNKQASPKSDNLVCHSFEEWKSHYLDASTEREYNESLRKDSSKLAISLANKTFNELLQSKADKALNK